MRTQARRTDGGTNEPVGKDPDPYCPTCTSKPIREVTDGDRSAFLCPKGHYWAVRQNGAWKDE